MTIQDQAPTRSRSRWPGLLLLSVIHVLSFGMLYLVLVQIAYAFSDHYKLVGFAETDKFSSVLWVSDYLAAYTWIFLLAIALDLVIVYRLFRNGNRWTSAYSHAVLLMIGCTAFVAISWMITPMVWSRPGTAKPAVADSDRLKTDFDIGSVAMNRSRP